MKCQALTKKSTPCRYEATHWHRTPGDAIHLCARHYKMITDQTRLGSDEQIVAHWLSVSPPAPDNE